MNKIVISCIFLVYAVIIAVITYYTSRKANDETFYRGNKSSSWYMVAYGMIGTSLSGVTFLSVPGLVHESQFSFMMFVSGYIVGAMVIAYVLMPIYFRINKASVYVYLRYRFGRKSYKTGAGIFLLGRSVTTALRLFVIIYVIHFFLLDSLGIPIHLTGFVFVLFITLYTLKGGIRTLVFTDVLQTTLMLAAVVLSIIFIGKELDWGIGDIYQNIKSSSHSDILITDWKDSRHFFKQFLGGVFITIAMTGLDQDMMQKSLSCRNLKGAQNNIISLGFTLIIANFIMLILGALVIMYAGSLNISFEQTDYLFAHIAVHKTSFIVSILFIIGLVAATFSSADGTLTSMTTSFCIDILGLDRKKMGDEKRKKTRYLVHCLIALFILFLMLVLENFKNSTIIYKILSLAGYTYGPLLGLFSFGLLTKSKRVDKYIPYICLLSPVLTYIADRNSEEWLSGYKLGFELLLLNGFITFTLLYILSSLMKATTKVPATT